MLAYYDSFYGLVPVKVKRVIKEGARWEIEAIVTANRKWGGYKRGTRIIASQLYIVPRTTIKRTKYNTYILPYDAAEEYKEFLK